MVFFYTRGNNGAFRIPAYPGERIDSSWFTPPFSGPDRHLFAVDTTTGTFQERCNYYAAGQDTSEGRHTCTTQSGLKYSNSTHALPADGATDAAGLYVTPLTLRLQELEQRATKRRAPNSCSAFTLREEGKSLRVG